MPIAARAAPRPSYLIERLVDAAARELDIAPDVIRRRNFIKPKAMPYTTPTGKIYDFGDFDALLARAKEMIDWDGFKKRAAASKRDGKLRGIGVSTYIEACGNMGPETATVHARQGRRRHHPDRLAIVGAGPRDRLCADRCRAARPAAGAGADAAGRHRQDQNRRRHRRLELDPVRRRLADQRGQKARR